MIRVKEVTPTRLVLTNAPNLWLIGAVTVFFFAGTIFVWGMAGTLGGFGLIFAIVWTALFAFIFGQLSWSNAIFDANTKTLETAFCRLFWTPRRLRHDLDQIDTISWDHVSLWSALIKPDDDIAHARSNLIIRRQHPKRGLTALEQVALGTPVHMEGLPEKLPEERASDVIRSWLDQARQT